MPLIATVGAVDANSYVTLGEAEAYFAARFDSDAFGELDPADQEKALLQATREVDRRRFKGCRHYISQALKFPRQYPYHRENPDSGTGVEIPRSVKEATCEQALWIAQHKETGGRNTRQKLQAQGVTQSRVGNVAESFDGTQRSLCPEARELLERWIDRWGRAVL